MMDALLQELTATDEAEVLVTGDVALGDAKVNGEVTLTLKPGDVLRVYRPEGR